MRPSRTAKVALKPSKTPQEKPFWRCTIRNPFWRCSVYYKQKRALLAPRQGSCGGGRPAGHTHT